MQQAHGPTAEQAQAKAQAQVKADKKKNKKQRRWINIIKLPH